MEETIHQCEFVYMKIYYATPVVFRVRGSIPVARALMLTTICLSKGVESLPEQYHTNCILVAPLDKIKSPILSQPREEKL